MRTALAACSCTAVFVLVLVVRGAGDWSRSLVILMYGLAAGSLLLGLAGLSIALFGRVADHQRGLVLLLAALPVLVAVGFGVLVLVLVTTPLN
jgi:hypothetical protein